MLDLMVQVEWDYAPTGEDLISGGLLEDNPDAVVFVEDTSSLIGRKYMKASPNACLQNSRVVVYAFRFQTIFMHNRGKLLPTVLQVVVPQSTSRSHLLTAELVVAFSPPRSLVTLKG